MMLLKFFLLDSITLGGVLYLCLNNDQRFFSLSLRVWCLSYPLIFLFAVTPDKKGKYFWDVQISSDSLMIGAHTENRSSAMRVGPYGAGEVEVNGRERERKRNPHVSWDPPNTILQRCEVSGIQEAAVATCTCPLYISRKWVRMISYLCAFIYSDYVSDRVGGGIAVVVNLRLFCLFVCLFVLYLYLVVGVLLLSFFFSSFKRNNNNSSSTSQQMRGGGGLHTHVLPLRLNLGTLRVSMRADMR
eukprot:gene10004-6984_t